MFEWPFYTCFTVYASEPIYSIKDVRIMKMYSVAQNRAHFGMLLISMYQKCSTNSHVTLQALQELLILIIACATTEA